MANKLKGKEKAQVPQDPEGVGAEEQQGLLPFIEQNQRLVLLVVGILLVVVAAFGAYRYLQTSQDAEAQEEMISAVRYFEADSLNRALNGDGSFLGFLDIAEEYSGTNAANMAEYYAGIIYFRIGDVTTALDYLQGVDGRGTMMEAAVYQAIGYCHEQLEEWEDAAKSFEQAATTPGESSLTPGLLLKAGQNYEDAGMASDALEVYQKIKEDYPRSPEAIIIEKYIGRISE